MTETFKGTLSHGSFTLERTFDHPPARVWRAWSDLSVRRRWFHGGSTWTEAERTFDFRIGGQDIVTGEFSARGKSRYVSTFHDIVPEKRIIHVYDMWIGGKYLSCSLATLLFRDEGGKTRLTQTEQGTYFDVPEHNDGRRTGTAGQLEAIAAIIDELE